MDFLPWGTYISSSLMLHFSHFPAEIEMSFCSWREKKGNNLFFSLTLLNGVLTGVSISNVKGIVLPVNFMNGKVLAATVRKNEYGL